MNNRDIELPTEHDLASLVVSTTGRRTDSVVRIAEKIPTTSRTSVRHAPALSFFFQVFQWARPPIALIRVFSPRVSVLINAELHAPFLHIVLCWPALLAFEHEAGELGDRGLLAAAVMARNRITEITLSRFFLAYFHLKVEMPFVS